MPLQTQTLFTFHHHSCCRLFTGWCMYVAYECTLHVHTNCICRLQWPVKVVLFSLTIIIQIYKNVFFFFFFAIILPCMFVRLRVCDCACTCTLFTSSLLFLLLLLLFLLLFYFLLLLGGSFRCSCLASHLEKRRLFKWYFHFCLVFFLLSSFWISSCLLLLLL